MEIKTGALKITIISLEILCAFLCYLFVVGLIKSVLSNDIYLSKVLFYIGMNMALVLSIISNFIVYSLLVLIDKDVLFTEKAIKKVSLIKVLSIFIFLSLIGILPMVLHIVQVTKVTGVIPVGIIIIGAPLILTTFIGVFEKLLKKMVQIKSENDLTV